MGPPTIMTKTVQLPLAKLLSQCWASFAQLLMWLSTSWLQVPLQPNADLWEADREGGEARTLESDEPEFHPASSPAGCEPLEPL